MKVNFQSLIASFFLTLSLSSNARLVTVFDAPQDAVQKENLTYFLNLALKSIPTHPEPFYITEQFQIHAIAPHDLVLYLVGTSYTHEGKILRDYTFDEELLNTINKKTPNVIMIAVDLESPAPDFDTHITNKNPKSGIFLGDANREERIIIRLVGQSFTANGKKIVHLPTDYPTNSENIKKLSAAIAKIIPSPKMYAEPVGKSLGDRQEASLPQQPADGKKKLPITQPHETTAINNQTVSELEKSRPMQYNRALHPEQEARTILHAIQLQLEDLARISTLDAADKKTINALLEIFNTQAGPSQRKIPQQLPVEPRQKTTITMPERPVPALTSVKNFPFSRANAKAQFQLNNYFKQRPQARPYEANIRESVKNKLFEIHMQGKKITQEIISQVINDIDIQY